MNDVFANDRFVLSVCNVCVCVFLCGLRVLQLTATY